MRLKQNVVLILILVGLLGSICLGIAIKGKVNNEPVVTEEPEVEVIPTHFAKAVNNGEKLPQEVLDVINNYMDDYFLSLYTLETQDTTKYFSNEVEGKISDLAIKLTVESRKLYDFDFTMSDASYVLNITDYYEIDGKHCVEFLEDDSFSFKFLNGITSQSFDVENSFVIEKVNDEYKISSLDKQQGYYLMFSDNRDEDLNGLYDFYLKRLTATIEDENFKKQKALDTPYVASTNADIKYDRSAAANYVATYYHTRNDAYYDFSEEGGNCQNFASQALVAGGMKMDEVGDCQWYYSNHLDYVAPWVHVSSFNEYCDENESGGLVCDLNSNVYYAEPGDLIQVGISSVSHTTIVSQIVDGHLLLSSNSIDMKDFPLEAYTYPVRKLIKILGSNY